MKTPMHKLICVMYHEIVRQNSRIRYTVREEQFLNQLECIKKHPFTSITTKDLNHDLPGRLIHISFDDAALSDHEVVLPVLKRNNLKATFFITTGYIGNPGYMKWSDVKELSENGFDIQSHTHTHSLLATQNIKKMQEEMKISRDILEQKLSKEIGAISVPGGSFNKKVAETAFLSGYKYIFTSFPRVNYLNGSNVFGRVVISKNLTINKFEKIILADPGFYLKLALSYQIKKTAKKIIGANSYYFLWKKFYKNQRHL